MKIDFLIFDSIFFGKIIAHLFPEIRVSEDTSFKVNCAYVSDRSVGTEGRMIRGFLDWISINW